MPFSQHVYIINRLPTPVLNHSSPLKNCSTEHLTTLFLEYLVANVFLYSDHTPITNWSIDPKLVFSWDIVMLGIDVLILLLTGYISLAMWFLMKALFPAKDHATLKLSSRINAASDAPFLIPVSLPFYYLYSFPTSPIDTGNEFPLP
jgi:hypothetical protein